MNASRKSLRLWAGALSATAALAIGLGIPPRAAQTTAQKPGTQRQGISAKQKTNPAVSSKPLPVPFRAGETLRYRVAWAAFSNAATLELAVPEQRDLFGSETWHFRAQAHTVSPVRSLFAIDDQFDSYTDEFALETRQYEMHLSELGKVEDDVLHLVHQGEVSHAPAPRTIVLPGTLDPLGVVYALRRVDWDRTPEFRCPVYDGHDMFDITARRDPAGDNIKVAAGSFSASHMTIRVFQHDKEMSAVHFSAWITNDATRKPVLIQAQLPFGSLRAELVSISQ